MIPVGILTASATSSFSFLLDNYPGASAAYSTRKLRAAYTGFCMQVRRANTTDILDIGFVNNVLDTTTLLTFCGVDDGNILIWYDQSGNGNNAISAGNFPRIVVGGVLQTLNSKPAIYFNSQSLVMLTPLSSNNNFAIFATQKALATNAQAISLGHELGAQGPFWGVWSNNLYLIQASLNNQSKFGFNSTAIGINSVIMNGIINSTDIYGYVNNTLNTFSYSNWTPAQINFNAIGRYFNFFSFMNMSELIVYKTDQTANRTGIVNNTNTFYSIY